MTWMMSPTPGHAFLWGEAALACVRGPGGVAGTKRAQIEQRWVLGYAIPVTQRVGSAGRGGVINTPGQDRTGDLQRVRLTS